MRKSESRARIAPNAAAAPRPALLSMAWIWRVAMLAGWIVTLGGVAWGVSRLHAYTQMQVATDPTEFRGLPVWLDDPGWQYAKTSILNSMILSPRDTIFTEDLAERIGRGLASNPWTEQVRRVWLRPDGAIELDAVFRRPLAAVVRDKNVYLCDVNGVRLPLERPLRVEEVNADIYFLITGVRTVVPPEGQAWQSRELLAGLKLVAWLESNGIRDLPLRRWLRAVDVSRFDTPGYPNGGLMIETIHPCAKLIWGIPPGDEAGIEASAERKLRHLIQEFSLHGQIPADRPLDLRPTNGIWRGSPCS